MTVIGGIDSHKQTLAAAAVAEPGRVLDVAQFTNSDAGHRQLDAWALAHGVARTGVAGSGNTERALVVTSCLPATTFGKCRRF
jgi:transposase